MQGSSHRHGTLNTRDRMDGVTVEWLQTVITVAVCDIYQAEVTRCFIILRWGVLNVV